MEESLAIKGNSGKSASDKGNKNLCVIREAVKRKNIPRWTLSKPGKWGVIWGKSNFTFLALPRAQ